MNNETNIAQFKTDKEVKIEALTTWIDEQGQWAEDYMSDKYNINNYAECFEGHNLFYGELDDEIQDHVKSILDDMDAYDILDFCDEPFIHYGYNRQYREIWSMNFGEIETELTNIYDLKTKVNCVYTELCKGLSEDDIKTAEDNSEWYVSNGSIYQDHSCDRVSITLDTEKFLKEYPMK